MSRLLRYSAVVTFTFWTGIAPAVADAQDIAPRTPPRIDWTASLRSTAGRELARTAVARRAPSPQQAEERSATKKVFGAIVGATGGFFAGGYLGAAIEGDRCNCDDPGLKGALIGAPIGAAVGGVLGALYLF